MKITPIDIQKHRFRKTFRGFDRDEVTAFMQALSEQVEKSVAPMTAASSEEETARFASVGTCIKLLDTGFPLMPKNCR